MAWRQFTYSLTEGERDQIEAALLSAGACAVTLEAATDEPIFEIAPSDRPLWQQIKLTALIDFELEADQFSADVNAQLGRSLNAELVEIIADKDWTREWMANFSPIACGQRLWIVPSWHTAPDANAVNLVLDPGLAFGSGTHPTTQMCLQWLDANTCDGQQVLDYGCGSGILAIAALLLGADQAIATDIDPQAVIATFDNAKRNHIAQNRLDCFVCGEKPIDSCADIVLANILANPLIALAGTLTAALHSGSHLVLSGILDSQAQMVIDAYADAVALEICARDDGWVLLHGVKA